MAIGERPGQMRSTTRIAAAVRTAAMSGAMRTTSSAHQWAAPLVRGRVAGAPARLAAAGQDPADAGQDEDDDEGHARR